MFARAASIKIPHVSSCSSCFLPQIKFPHVKKWPSDTKDKNASENVSVLTSDVAIITFGECI